MRGIISVCTSVPWPGGCFKDSLFHFPYLGKWSNLTNIFQMGWNHQLDDMMTESIHSWCSLCWHIICSYMYSRYATPVCGTRTPYNIEVQKYVHIHFDIYIVNPVKFLHVFPTFWMFWINVPSSVHLGGMERDEMLNNRWADHCQQNGGTFIL